MNLVIVLVLISISIVCFIAVSNIGRKRDEMVKLLRELESDVDDVEQEQCGSAVSLEGSGTIMNDVQPQIVQSRKTVEQQVLERRAKWLEIEHSKKIAMQKRREQNEKLLKLQDF